MDEDFERRLGYVIVCRDNQGQLQFLVDRNKFKNAWWSKNLSQAFGFISEIAAQKYIDKIHYYKFKQSKMQPQVRLRTEFHRN